MGGASFDILVITRVFTIFQKGALSKGGDQSPFSIICQFCTQDIQKIRRPPFLLDPPLFANPLLFIKNLKSSSLFYSYFGDVYPLLVDKEINQQCILQYQSFLDSFVLTGLKIELHITSSSFLRVITQVCRDKHHQL